MKVGWAKLVKRKEVIQRCWIIGRLFIFIFNRTSSNTELSCEFDPSSHAIHQSNGSREARLAPTFGADRGPSTFGRFAYTSARNLWYGAPLRLASAFDNEIRHTDLFGAGCFEFLMCGPDRLCIRMHRRPRYPSWLSIASGFPRLILPINNCRLTRGEDIRCRLCYHFRKCRSSDFARRRRRRQKVSNVEFVWQVKRWTGPSSPRLTTYSVTIAVNEKVIGALK